MIRLLYLGQKPIGERCFEIVACYKSKHQIGPMVVVSNVTSGKTWWKSTDVASAVRRHDAFIPNEEKHEEAIIFAMKNYDINTIISVQHPWILSKKILEMVNYNAYNLHLAKLPEYRGYNSFTHAILNCDSQYWITIHRMADEVDKGDIVLQDYLNIAPNETAWSLYQKATDMGVKLFEQFIVKLVAELKLATIPMEGEGRFYPKDSINGLKEIDGIIGERCLGIYLLHAEFNIKARAFYFPPFEPAYFVMDGKKFYILPESGWRKNNEQNI
jgi:methionyl-tRNA formyltransferase